MTHGAARTWLRLEGLAMGLAGLALYAWAGGSWLLLLPLFLLPDISAIGYLANARVGSHTYNLLHNWLPGVAVLGLAVSLQSTPLLLAAAILIAHVGFDRALGYGLKLPTSFQDTHLGRIGRARDRRPRGTETA